MKVKVTHAQLFIGGNNSIQNKEEINTSESLCQYYLAIIHNRVIAMICV